MEIELTLVSLSSKMKIKGGGIQFYYNYRVVEHQEPSEDRKKKIERQKDRKLEINQNMTSSKNYFAPCVDIDIDFNSIYYRLAYKLFSIKLDIDSEV